MATVETTVLGGLLVEVDFSVCPAEPDVGIMSEYVENWQIVGINGKAKKNTDWILKRLSRRDEAAITEACENAACGW